MATLCQPSRLSNDDIAWLALPIARGLGFAIEIADDHSWRWYQDLLNGLPTDEQANDLRFLVILECVCQDFGGKLVPGFAAPPPYRETPLSCLCAGLPRVDDGIPNHPCIVISPLEDWFWRHQRGAIASILGAMAGTVAYLACKYMGVL